MQNVEHITPQNKFKPFNETFPHCAFALAISLLYPNKHNIFYKIKVFTIVMVINFPMLFWYLAYLYKCVRNLDMYNLSRQVAIGILVTLFFFKYFYVLYKNAKYADILQNITDDLLKGNTLEEDYQEIYEDYIRLGKMGQTCWIIIPVLLSSQFPLYAAGCMIYDVFVSEKGEKYMVHEQQLKFFEDVQYETPFFEFVFAYNLIQCVVLSPNFAGFDGSFCIATTHLRLKLKLMTHKVHRAFKDAKDKSELERKVKEAIKDHQAALVFYNDVQEVYGGWLLVVFLLTSLMVSMSLYQIYLSDKIDTKHTIFAISGVIHMFTPCYFASNLVKTSEELSLDIYNVPWESWADPVVTKLIIFMIAKSQQPLLLSGNGMAYFNMQLFISVMQTSYSFFTLISN